MALKHASIEPQAVIAWLEEHHPDLEYEQDRHWMWVTNDLRQAPATRESLKMFGFRFARNPHKLPSGKLAMWAHHCNAPTPFFRRNKTSPARVEVPAADDATMKELLEFAEGIK